MSVGRAARRDATLTAIKQTARELVRTEGPDGIGLRAVARRLGLTAPALYRYVASHQDLIDLVVADIYDELCAALEDAIARVPEDPGARLAAASRAFRRWALAHRPEFGLVFAHPIAPDESPRDPDAGKARFARVFGRLFTALWRARPFPVPDALRPDVAAQVEARAGAYVPGVPVGAAYVFVRCWARLYGAVCLEVFGHLDWALDDPEPLFEQTLAELARDLGQGDDLERDVRRARS